MNGMTSRLNLQVDQPGTYQGLSSHFSGDGFSGMHFDVHAVTSEQFSKWAQDASGAAKSLDARSYEEVAKASMDNAPAIYRLAEPDLFSSIVTQELPPSAGAQAGVKGASLQAGVADVR
jgi:cytochrome o ubiquinol oxidase subunit 2